MRNCFTPTADMRAEWKRERIAYKALIDGEMAKKFIVKDEVGSSRFATLEEAEKWARQNASILCNARIVTSK